ncbi:MAG: glycosyltransferase family 2 protein [Thiohalocapsa sp.]
MNLSVIVCTFNRYDMLTQCLQALQPGVQTEAGERYEIIVVDNTPDPARRSGRGFPSSKWIVCDEVGLSNARNVGIAAASGDIVAFIDDDAIAAPGWCHEIISVFARHPLAVAAGGKVVPEYPAGAAPHWLTNWHTNYLSCLDWGEQEHQLREREWIVGTNMAFRRSAFAEVGVFSSELGRKGDRGLLSNEEIVLIRRLGRERIVYDPAMLVSHVIAPERLTQAWLRKRVFWQAISDQLAGIDIPDIDCARAELRRIVPRLPAERRNLNGLWDEVETAEDFSLQLRQLSVVAHLLASGMTPC